MNKFFGILRKCPLFNGIEDSNLISMLACLGGVVKKYAKKETVLREGEPARYIGIVLDGAVRIERTDYYGNRTIIGKIESPQLFGESFACAGVDAVPVSVIAEEETQVMLIEHGRMLHSCGNACDFHRRLIYNLMQIVAVKNLIFHQKIEITSKKTTRERLISYLLLQAKNAGENSFEIPYNRQELADYLEVDRSGLSVEISKLQREGKIIANRKKFTLIKELYS